MWHLGTWSSGGFGSAGLTVRLDDLRDVFQPEQSYDSFKTSLPAEFVVSLTDLVQGHVPWSHFRPGFWSLKCGFSFLMSFKTRILTDAHPDTYVWEWVHCTYTCPDIG